MPPSAAMTGQSGTVTPQGMRVVTTVTRGYGILSLGNFPDGRVRKPGGAEACARLQPARFPGPRPAQRDRAPPPLACPFPSWPTPSPSANAIALNRAHSGHVGSPLPGAPRSMRMAMPAGARCKRNPPRVPDAVGQFSHGSARLVSEHLLLVLQTSVTERNRRVHGWSRPRSRLQQCRTLRRAANQHCPVQMFTCFAS